jgi:hypothetical protein
MQIYFIPFGKLARFHLGSWLIFIWEVGSFTTFAPSSVLLTSPHIIEVVREAYATKSTAHRRHTPRHRRPQQSHTKTPLNPHD